MHKARKEIARAVRSCKLVIEVMDARTPFSSENPLVPELRGSVPCLKVLNKSDLADPSVTADWIEEFQKEEGVSVIAVNGKIPKEARKVLARGRKLIRSSNEDKHTLIMILGVPNSGKSTLINALAQRKVCKVGNRPAVTRQQQLISLTRSISLLDTPGFLWPKLDPPECAMRLCISGAVREGLFDPIETGKFLTKHVMERHPLAMQNSYRRKDEYLSTNVRKEFAGSPEQVLLEIGRRRGVTRGIDDLEKITNLVLNDYRTGKLGLISLETPEMVKEEEGIAAKLEGVRGRPRREEAKLEKKRKKKLEKEDANFNSI